MTLKLAGWGALAAAVVFGAGWFVGASGSAASSRSAARPCRAPSSRKLARACSKDACSCSSRISARPTKAFEAARVVVTGAQTRLRQVGDAARAGQLEVAIAQLREAQRLSLALGGPAQAAADEALRVIDAVSSATPGR